MKKIHFIDGRSYTPSKIICVGRNYAKHIEEMKSAPTKDPVLFLKPNSALHNFTDPEPNLIRENPSTSVAYWVEIHRRRY